MRRIIFTVLCALVALGASSQIHKEKSIRVHKTDGTVAEYPVGGVRNLSLKGKSVIKDDDYTRITDVVLAMQGTCINIDITAAFSADDPYVNDSRYGRDWGILYSTEPDITIENSTLITLGYPLKSAEDLSSHEVSFRVGESVEQSSDNGVGCYLDLDYNTTYYFRSYVYRPASEFYGEEYYYSSVHGVNTGNPSMKFFDVNSVPAYAAELGYVYPAEEAWTAFDGQYPYFALGKTLVAHWNDFLTPERIEKFKPQCNVVHDCVEGTLYILDTIGEEFCQYLLDYYGEEYEVDLSAAVLDAAVSTEATYVECDASWNVSGNGYWKYTAAKKRNPSITLSLPKLMMANYPYKIEITLAPNTEVGDTLPSKVTARIYDDVGVRTIIATEFETNVDECSVISIEDFKTEFFGEAVIEILSDMETGSRSPDAKKYLPILRVVQVKVTPCDQ